MVHYTYVFNNRDGVCFLFLILPKEHNFADARSVSFFRLKFVVFYNYLCLCKDVIVMTV